MVIFSRGLDLALGSVISASDVDAVTIIDGVDVRVFPVIILSLFMVGVSIHRKNSTRRYT